jgi:hypothetical protein
MDSFNVGFQNTYSNKHNVIVPFAPHLGTENPLSSGTLNNGPGQDATRGRLLAVERVATIYSRSSEASSLGLIRPG